ncbi:hypothetical protein ACFQ08_15830 [Streptosporangium algeriense]|uniref:Uncharacterized protein n=1 Tax=Streptosporangium algeriense TaxID=1682748 RepID=A0ABW3DQ88_9ACTN
MAAVGLLICFSFVAGDLGLTSPSLRNEVSPDPLLLTIGYTGLPFFLFMLVIGPRIRGPHRRAIKENRRILAGAHKAGDSAGVAYALRSLGIIHTDIKDLAIGFDYTTKSFALHRQLGDDVTPDLHILARQREMMGDSKFFKKLHEALDEATADDLVRLLGGSEPRE